jgi:ribonuclease P protein component
LRIETLKRRTDFDRVRQGRKWVTRAFILQGLVREADTLGRPRFGFAVASKALSEETPGGTVKRAGAVKRNRARRRLKEAVRLLAPHHARPDYDYVVIGRREALHLSFADLLEDFQLAFGKVHRPPRAGTDRPENGRKSSAGEPRQETGNR